MTQVKASIALEERLAEAETRIIELERALNRYKYPKRDKTSKQLDEQRFRRLFEANNVGVAIADTSGRVWEANEYYLNLLGTTRQELLQGRVQWDVPTPSEFAEVDQKALEQLRTKGVTVPLEKEYLRADGRRVAVLVSGVLLPGDEDRILALVIDRTEQKQTEQALRQAKDQLEERVRERTAELTETVHSLQDEIEQRYQAESQLQAAYEQLNLKAGQLRALATELTLAEQRERRRLATILHDHLQQLLVGAKLRVAVLARQGGPRVREATAEIENLLTESIKASRSLTAELSPPILYEEGLEAGLEWLTVWMRDKHGFSVHVEAPDGLPDLSADITVFLFESLRELLFNAVKHSQVKSATVTIGHRKGNLAQFVVSDHGIGFKPAKGKTGPQTEGGLGLFSIGERASLLGGSIRIDSAPGRGTRIVLEVPSRHSSTSPAVPTAGPRPGRLTGAGKAGTAPASGKPIRLLLADDHAVVREGLAMVLGQEPDIEIVGQAVDGQEAVEMARQLHPEVILMDVNMPRLNGIQATRTIHSELPDIRIIGLSMFEETEAEQAMREGGAADYRSKSGPAAQLIEAIRESRTDSLPRFDVSSPR